MSVGHLSRAVESRGIPTVTLYVEAWEPMAPLVRPPRVVVTPFLQGRTAGPPHRDDVQIRVLRDALGFIEKATEENWLLKLT